MSMTKFAKYLKAERGRITDLANFLGISVSTVAMWASEKRRVPVEYAPGIFQWSHHQLNLRDIRPDIFRPYTR